MTRVVRFTQADIRRAMMAAQQAGYQSPRVIIRPNGEIEVVTGKPNNEADNDEEDFDL